MKILILMFYFITLTGCASASAIYAPDGSVAYTLDCSGAARSWNMCYEKAGQLCRSKGYEVIGGGSESNSTAFATNAGAYGATYNTRNMVIKCN